MSDYRIKELLVIWIRFCRLYSWLQNSERLFIVGSIEKIEKFFFYLNKNHERFNENEHGKAEDNIPLQLQLIFAQLQQNAHRQNVNTRNLIHSFQWDHIEAFQQHDVQVRVL